MTGSPASRTWKDAVEDLQFVGVLPPQAQDVVLPADHLAQDQHDGDGGQADEEEERVGPLHHIQPLLVAHHLDGRRDGQSGETHPKHYVIVRCHQHCPSHWQMNA